MPGIEHFNIDGMHVQVGDWADVLTRFDDDPYAEVRWRPGPYEITGGLSDSKLCICRLVQCGSHQGT